MDHPAHSESKKERGASGGKAHQGNRDGEKEGKAPVKIGLQGAGEGKKGRLDRSRGGT